MLQPQDGEDGDNDESEAGTWPQRQQQLENMANFVVHGRDGHGAGSIHGGNIRGNEMGYLRAPVAWYPEVIWT